MRSPILITVVLAILYLGLVVNERFKGMNFTHKNSVRLQQSSDLSMIVMVKSNFH